MSLVQSTPTVVICRLSVLYIDLARNGKSRHAPDIALRFQGLRRISYNQNFELLTLVSVGVVILFSGVKRVVGPIFFAGTIKNVSYDCHNFEIFGHHLETEVK